MKKLISLLLLVILLASCATSTMVTFNSNVEGANVYVDDELVGQTPLELRMSNFVTDEPTVSVEKEGYKKSRKPISKEVKVGNFISGLFFWFPYLWVYGPKEIQSFRLQEEK